MRCARAAPITDEVSGATIEPSAVRVMGILMTVTIQMMFDSVADILVNVQIITLWHAAGLNNPRSLVLSLVSFIDESLRTLSSPLIAFVLLFQSLSRSFVFICGFLIACIRSPTMLLLILLFTLLLRIVIILLFLLLVIRWGAPALSLLLRSGHSEMMRLLEVEVRGVT